MSAGHGERRVKRELENDAKNWKKGTAEVGRLSETPVVPAAQSAPSPS